MTGFYLIGRRDPFIVYTSNIFAMLGLRSLYFVLAGVVDRFRYLSVGLAAILIFFGARLLLGDIIEVPTGVSLSVIAAGLALSVAAFDQVAWPKHSSGLVRLNEVRREVQIARLAVD